MKWQMRALSLFAGAILLAAPFAQAGVGSVLNTAAVLPAGGLTIAAEGYTTVDPYEGGGFGHVNYGLRRNATLNSRAGWVADEFYIGTMLEVPFLRAAENVNGPSISAALGVHYWHDPGLDGTINLSYGFGRASAYAALDTDVNFTGDTSYPSNLALGLEYGTGGLVSVVGEVGFNLSESQNYLTAGVRIYP